MIIGLVTIIGTVIAGSFFEWFLHNGMHLSPDYERLHKHEAHHGDFPPKAYKNPDHAPGKVQLPNWTVILTVTPFTVVGLVISKLTCHYEIVVFAFLTSAFYHIAYQYVHTCFHVPKGRWFEKTALYGDMDRYHHVHHVKEMEFGLTRNLCLLCPIADCIM